MHCHQKLFATFVGVNFLLFVTLQGNIFDFIRIYAQAGPTTTATISVGSPQGNNGWYVGGVTITLTASGPMAIQSITFRLDSGTPSTVNAASTAQTFSQNGNHTLYFYATDVNAVQETPEKSITFKVDTVSPINWSNITQVRDGNEHTFRFSATVTDATAGLDPARAYMQYNVDDTGATWGYYTNLLNCNSQWNANQWYQLPTQSFAAGAPSGTIETPPVDYCNSSGSGCDFMKLRIYDMAGNISDKKICLGDPWLQTQSGNVHSVSNISMNAEGPQPNASFIISTQGNTINSFTSQNNWRLTGYTNSANLTDVSYAALNAKYGGTASGLPSGRLPTTSGVYKVNSNFTVTSSVIPSGYASAQNFATVILINGTLTINTDITTHANSVVMFVASGGINIDRGVANLSGVYVSNGLFDSSYNGNSNTQLQIRGAAFSQGGFDLARTLGTTTNKTTPAELIIQQPQYFLNTELQKIFAGNIRYDWREANQ